MASSSITTVPLTPLRQKEKSVTSYNNWNPSIAAGAMAKPQPRICTPIMADTVDLMAADVIRAKTLGADVVELRLDSLKIFEPQNDLPALIRSSPLPTLVTFRPDWEGGLYDGDESKRLEVLKFAMELGADYVDVEFQVADKFSKYIHGRRPENFKLIVSSHNYENTPSIEDLSSLVSRIQSTGADIVKVATTGLDITDAWRMLQVTLHSQVPVIGVVMGDRGMISRLLVPKFGGYLTFAALAPGKQSDPGQPTLAELIELYSFRLIGPQTKVLGLIGNPVRHSKAPMLFNQTFKSVGFDGVYLHFLVDDVLSFLNTYISADFPGFSCTLPHKETLLKCCHEVNPLAKGIGAVNCVVRGQDDGKLYGYNTDCFGAISAIEDALRAQDLTDGKAESPLAGKTFVVIGAGGAGKALAYGAKEKGANVVIANRTYERGVQLAKRVSGKAITLAELETFHPEDGMILANTTSVGMYPITDQTPAPKQALKNYMLVFDAVYTPKETRLLKEAAECGVTVVTGVEMFIIQAYEQYERLTGLPVPKELFRKIMEKY